MEFFVEMLLTAVVAVLFSFLVAKLLSLSMDRNNVGGVNDRSSDQADETEIGVGDDLEELRFGLKIDAPVVQSERRLRVVVDENVEHVDRVVVVDGVEEGDKGEAGESLAAVSPENVIAEEMIVHGEGEQRDSSEQKVSEEQEEFIVQTAEEAESTSTTASVLPENVIEEEIMIRGQEVTNAEEDVVSEGQGQCFIGLALVTDSEDVGVEESSAVEESEHKMELNTVEEGEDDELSIEQEDDDWEGIERSELEKAFVTTSNLLEESGKAEEISDEVKMELYGLHKIATEGSCREAQPMAIMVSARAKWNAWQKLGNMSQEEAMEQYLALVSKEVPGLINTVGKIPVLPPN